METFFNRSQSSRELKRLFREKAAEGKPLSVMEDAVFKAMLTSDTDDSREALRSLLSACIGRSISQVQVTHNDLVPAHLDAKSTRLDVHVIFNDGEAADLEMQIGKSDDDLKARAEICTAMLLAGQSRKGHPYREIKRVYQIFFLNCTLYPHSDKLPRRYHCLEEKEHDRLTDLTEIIMYEMPKLERCVQAILNGTAKANSLRKDEKWCIYMKYRHEERAAPLMEKLYGQEEGIMRAEQAVKGIDRDYLRFARKMAIQKNKMDRAQAVYNFQQEYIAELRAEGLAEGQAKEKLEIARNALSKGATPEFVQEITGLPADAIKNIQASL